MSPGAVGDAENEQPGECPVPILRRIGGPHAGPAAAEGAARGTGAARPGRLPRAAHRRASERVRPGRRRAAGLAHRLHRLLGHGRRAGRQRRHLRRRALHGAGPRTGGRHGLHARTPHRDAARGLAGAAPEAGQVLGYDPALHTPDGARRFEKACRAAPARSSSRSTATRSTPSGRTALPRPARRWCCTQWIWPARTAPPSSARIQARLGQHGHATRWSSRTRTPWPGRSTSAAATSPTRRCRSATPWCRARGARRCSWTAESSPTRCATPRRRRRHGGAGPARPHARWRSARAKARVRFDQATASQRIVGLRRSRRRHGRDRPRSQSP